MFRMVALVGEQGEARSSWLSPASISFPCGGAEPVDVSSLSPAWLHVGYRNYDHRRAESRSSQSSNSIIDSAVDDPTKKLRKWIPPPRLAGVSSLSPDA